MTAYKKGTDGWARATAKFKETIKERYGEDYFRELGRKGGSAAYKRPKGFASTVVGRDGLTGKERAHRAGKVGGKISRRGPAKKEVL